MKKIIYTLGIIAASAAAFTACQKEQATNDDVLPDGKLVTISFTAEKAGLETKTAAVEGETSVSYIWTDDDIANIKLFTVTDGSITGEVDSPTVTKVSDTQLTISATVAANATYTFRAILCDPASYTGSGDDYTSRKPKIKTSQSPNGTSNFDSTADILVSDDKEVTVGEDETTTGDMLLSFRRQVVVNKMTLKNLVEGEKISKVIVKSDKHLTGYLNNGSMEGQAKELSLNYDNVAVPASGQFVVYFITMENTGQTLTVEVTTNQNTYSKTFGSTIDFNLGQFTKFGVSLPAGTPLVDYSGTYALGSADGTKIAKAYASGSNIPAADASLEGSVLYYDPDVVTIADAQITLSRIVDSESTYYGMYTIVQNGLYLYAASNSANQLKAKDYLVDEVVVLDADAYWSVSCTDGNWAISADKSSNRNVLRFNSTLFSCYASTSSGTAFALYPIANVKPTPVITADASIELSSDAVSSSTSTGATFNSNTSTVTAGAYSDAECTAASSWLTVSTSGSGSSTVVNYTATANDTGSERTAYIKITATNSDSHSVNTVIKVTQAAAGAITITYSKYSGVLTEGDYVIYYSGKAMKNTVSSSRFTYSEVTPSDDKITNPDASIVWHIAASGDYWTIYSADVEKYACGTGAANKAALYATADYNNNGQGLWACTSTAESTTYDFVNKCNTTASVNATLRNNTTYGFACYSTSTGGALTLYKLDN